MFIWKIIIFFRLLLGKECDRRYREKFSITDKKNNTNLDTIWIHAVSVGEMNSAEILIKELSKNFFVLLTTTSFTSAKLAEKFQFKNFVHQFNPVDWPFYIKKFLNHWKIKKAIFIESEFWPFTIYCTSKVADIYLINARFSEKSYKRWFFFKNIFFKKILTSYKKIYPSGNFSRTKFESFGIQNIENNINTKIFNKNEFIAKAQNQQNIFPNLKKFINNRKIISFVSLHLSEVSTIFPLIKNILKEENNFIIILPRKIQEANAIKDFISKNLSSSKNIVNIYNQQCENNFIFSNERIIILNEMGIAPFVYNISDENFVCGSFIAGIGGHNPLEGLFLYKKCYFGNFYEKNIDLIEDLKKNNLLNIIETKDFDKIDFTQKENLTDFQARVDDFFARKMEDFLNFLQLINNKTLS